MHTIDTYFGLGSRYSYLAFTQFKRIESQQKCRFNLYPLSSVELMHLRGKSPFDGQTLSGQYEWTYRQRDAEAWAKFYSVPYVETQSLPDDHRLMAKACWAADHQNELWSYCRSMFNLIFADNGTVDAGACVTVAESLKLDVDKFVASLESSEVDTHVTSLARTAIERGVFGVPTFVIDSSKFWGNDRLVLLEHYLRSTTR